MIKSTKKASKGPYMWAMNARNIYLHHPTLDDFDIETIATALSRICRFGAMSKVWYSVAEHCIRVANLVAEDYADKDIILHALLHDASESFLGDLIKPIKYEPAVYAAYSPIENKFMKVIAKKFNFTYNKGTKKIIKYYDNKMAMAEIRDLMCLSTEEKNKLNFDICKDVPYFIRTMSIDQAKRNFLYTFNTIQNMD